MNRPALCSALMQPLIKALEALSPKARTPVEEDPDEEPEDHGERKVTALLHHVERIAQ